MQKQLKLSILIIPFLLVLCQGDFRSYNDCIRGTDDSTAENVTNWTLYNDMTWNNSGLLIDYSTGLPTSITATFTWNSSAGLAISETSGSADGESQPRPGTPAYEVFGGIADFSNRLIYYGSSGWWVEIEFTGLDPDTEYTFVTTAIRGTNYTARLTLFTLSGHLNADNNSSDGVYLKDGDQTVLQAGGNHTDTTGYVVRWDNIVVADQGDGTGSFSVRAEAYGSDYRAYPFGGFMLEGADNLAPAVDAGANQTLVLPKQYLTLEGSVEDDGQGNPDGFLQTTWTQIDGPTAVEFITDIHQPEMTVHFPAEGTYLLQLGATDGELETTDTVTITVESAICPSGDLDGDCRVRLSDLAILAGGWMDDTESPLSDLNGDAAVDTQELTLLSQSWLDDWTGSLQVDILPAAAAAAGAQWRMDEGNWQSSGQVLSGIGEGSHTVDFSVVSGWFTPDPQTVEIVRQQTAAVSGHYTEAPASVVIHEFLAVNSNVGDLRPVPAVNTYTQVDGQPVYEDWIELANATDETVDPEGWYLTDNADNLTKWQFPAGYSIPAGGYLVVYTSNKDESKYGWPFVDDLGKLHTNFELNSGGKYLALVRPNGIQIEHEYNEYPEQRGLVSYGLSSDGQIGYLTEVTRGADNSDIYEGLVADTQFSIDRGFYDTPFSVSITCQTSGAQIRYTTNGSAPTETNGTVYTDPISIPTTTCLRATAFLDGYLPSNVDTQTYIFLDDVLTQATNTSTGAQVVPTGYPTTWPGGSHSGSITGDYQMDPDVVNSTSYGSTLRNDLKDIPSLCLTASVSDLFGSEGIYINEDQDGTERIGSAELIDPNGIEGFQINCGIRMQGGASEFDGGTTLNRWKSDKLSFRLNFRGVYDGKLKYSLFGTDGAQTYDTIVLDCRPQNSWVHENYLQRLHGEYVRDQVASDTQLAMGGYACRGRPLHLYINGLYWGMYWIHERPDDAFAASYIGGEEDDYDVIKHDVENVISGDNTDYIAMFALSATSPDAPTAFENLRQKLDVADFIDYLLANFYIANGDWDHKNWYATHNHFDPDGRWRWHMWDGEHIMDDKTFTPEDVTTTSNSYAPTGLHHKWITNAEYRTLFGDRVHKHFFHDGALVADNFTALFTNLTDQIDRAIVGESARWGDNQRSASPYTRNNEWLTEVNRLLTEFIPDRRDVVLAQFTSKNPAWYPTVTAPEFYINGQSQYGGDADVGASLTLDAGSNPIWYTLDGSDPRAAGGNINTESAVSYTTSISLDGSVHIKARTRTTGGDWSALAEAAFAVGSAADTLRVTELMYHPADPNLEFIELKNIGTSTVNLNLVQFTNGITHTFGDVSVEPEGFLLLVKNQSIFEASYSDLPADVPVVQWTDGSLDNGGETLTLVDVLGRIIQSFTYNDSWYPLTDGGGFSLTLLDPLSEDPESWSQKDAWRVSTVAGGSPGEEETGLLPGSIVINELLAHSNDALPDWIELYNTTDQAISLGGWYLSDSESDLMQYPIPEPTEIPASGYVMFYEDTDFGVAFALSENGETLYLTSGAGGQITGYQTTQKFDASMQNVSLGRYIRSDDDMDFVAMNSQTPGAANDTPRVGPIVISEIHYHPGDDDTGGEYLELKNISPSAVTLQDVVRTETAPGVFEDETVCWTFTEGIDFTFPADTEIPAGGFVIVAADPTALNLCYASQLPSGTTVLGPFENETALSNGGEKVRLCRPGEKPYGQSRLWIRVDQVTYDDSTPWPTEPDGDGDSLQRILHSAYGNDPANWMAGVPRPGQ